MAEDVRVAAKAYALLHIPDKNGTVKYNELQQIEASAGIHDPLLDEATPPQEAFFVFDLYWRTFRSVGVSYSEILAWKEITGQSIETWEVDLLFMIHNTVEHTIYERDIKK